MTQVPSRADENPPRDIADIPGVAAYTFGRFRLDLLCHQLLQDEQPIALTGKAFDVLVTLVRRRERTVTKEDLIRAVWHDAFVSEENLTQAIYVLRRALGDDSANPQFIGTVARRGYRFLAPVTEVPLESKTGGPELVAVAPPPVDVAPAPEPAARRVRAPAALLAAAAVVALVAVGAVMMLRQDPVTPARARLTLIAPPGTTLISGAVVSPDSRRLAFVARDDAQPVSLLWIQALDTGEMTALAGTEGAFRPFWAPDSSAIGFFTGGRIKTVGIEDGVVRNVAAAGVTPTGGTWNSDGTILFADISSVVLSVPAAGGQPTPATTLDTEARETGHRRPQFLPDGRTFLFTVASADSERAGTWAGSLGSSERTRVLPSQAIFVPPDRLLFTRSGALLAQAFDPATLAVSGEPETVANGVTGESTINSTSISASAAGILTFGGGTSSEHLAWFDRTGQRLATLAMPAKLHDPTLSIDGTQVLAESATGESRGIWRVDIDRGSATRLVNDGTIAMMSPDGTQVAYSSIRGTTQDIYVRSAMDDSGEKRLVSNAENKYVGDWSRNGLVFVSRGPVGLDIWTLENGKDQPVRLLGSPANEIQPSVSPDGRWIAYASDESGQWEVYVQAFPGLGRKRAISVGGGVEPLWRRDGRELYYLALDHTLTAVDVSGGDTLTVGAPRALFRAPISWNAPLYRSFYRRHYVATADGSRFGIAATDPNGAQPVTVLVNWRVP